MKRKYAKPMIILCLIAILAIVGTLAYLTDTTEELVNSFTVDDEVSIEINETYTDFVLNPGTTQDKDPEVTVLADDSYVFIEVIETIPTVALTNNTSEIVDDYTFASYVNYIINTDGGSIYQWDDTLETPALSSGTTNWAWTLVQIADSNSVTTTGNYTKNDDGGTDAYTKITYVYALTDTNGNLLSVSSLDKDGINKNLDATYPILAEDKVTIPSKLTQAMLDLLIITDSDPEATYTVDLSFIGYAIQSDGIVLAGDDAMSIADVYSAAKSQ